MPTPESHHARSYAKTKVIEALLKTPIEDILKEIDVELTILFDLYISIIINLDFNQLEIKFASASKFSKVLALVEEFYVNLEKKFAFLVRDREKVITFQPMQVEDHDLIHSATDNPNQPNLYELIIVQNIKVGDEVFSIGLFRTNSIPYQYQLRFCVT